MIALISLASVVTGVVLACMAERYPAHVETIETGAGVLLIAGLATLGSGFPIA